MHGIGKLKMVDKDAQIAEVLCIIQEECAEVIQAVSKISRFGFDSKHPERDFNNRQHLEEEIGDLSALIDILMEMGIVDWGKVSAAKRAKREKLKIWSNIPLV